jgi:hypothetical protein
MAGSPPSRRPHFAVQQHDRIRKRFFASAFKTSTPPTSIFPYDHSFIFYAEENLFPSPKNLDLHPFPAAKRVPTQRQGVRLNSWPPAAGRECTSNPRFLTLSPAHYFKWKRNFPRVKHPQICMYRLCRRKGRLSAYSFRSVCKEDRLLMPAIERECITCLLSWHHDRVTRMRM